MERELRLTDLIKRTHRGGAHATLGDGVGRHATKCDTLIAAHVIVQTNPNSGVTLGRAADCGESKATDPRQRRNCRVRRLSNYNLPAKRGSAGVSPTIVTQPLL